MRQRLSAGPLVSELVAGLAGRDRYRQQYHVLTSAAADTGRTPAQSGPSELIAPLWPCRQATSCPVSVSQRRTVPSEPQVAILSLDAVAKKPVARGESIAVRPMGVLAQSFDHRAFDGAYSAAFLHRLKEIIEGKDWSAALKPGGG